MEQVMNLRVAFALIALPLAGCAHAPTPIVETQYKTITVTKRGPCPSEGVYNRLKAGRPNPLRNQARPRTGVERTARTSAQLGLYERSGGWADQVVSALDRCQVSAEESEEKQGVASEP
jgi:hypothetical protein